MGDRLIDFEIGLSRLIGRPSRLRPFVCDGSPLNCRVFLVGHNPATEMDTDFWNYWTEQGFDKARWHADYLIDRRTRPIRPGRTRRPAVSPTRRVIELIIEGARMPILETNIHATPTVDAKSLNDKDQRPFKFLLETIRPYVIVAHGKDAIGAMRKMDVSANVIGASHFSRGWSSERALAFGRDLSEIATAMVGDRGGTS